MKYIHTTTLATFSLSEIRAAHPQVSIPDGADLSDMGYGQFVEVPAPMAAMGFKAVQGSPVQADGVWRTSWIEVPLTADEIAERAASCWSQIKKERDRRAVLGVKVGAHWFHSDQQSRTQQLALTSSTLVIPSGLQWKTLTFAPPPVFVVMTRELAIQIVQATAASDSAIFVAAEIHRMTMEASPDPDSYDFSGGWPPSIEDEAHEAGFQFDAVRAA